MHDLLACLDAHPSTSGQRGELGRHKAKRARATRAPLLKSRRLCAMAEEAMREGRLDNAMQHLSEVKNTCPIGSLRIFGRHEFSRQDVAKQVSLYRCHDFHFLY